MAVVLGYRSFSLGGSQSNSLINSMESAVSLPLPFRQIKHIDTAKLITPYIVTVSSYEEEAGLISMCGISRNRSFVLMAHARTRGISFKLKKNLFTNIKYCVVRFILNGILRA